LRRRAGGRAGYRAALRSRDLRRLLGSQLASASGSWAYNTALVVLLYDLTHSAGWVAAGTLARYLPSLVFSGYGGVIAERFERVRLLVWLNVIALVFQAGLAAAAWRAAPALIAVMLSVLTSVVLSPYNPAVAALIPQIVSEDDLAAAHTLNGTIGNVVVFVGPALGTVLLLAGGPALAIAVNALSFGVAAVWLLGVTVRSRPGDVTAGGRAGPLRQVAEGFSAVAASGPAATFVAFCVIVTFVAGADMVLFVPISRIQLHSGTSGYGYLLAGLGVGGLVGAAFVGRLAARTRLAAAILGGVACFCLPTALLVVVHQPAIAFGLQVVRGAGTLVVDTLAITALQRSAPKEMVARVFGAFFAFAYGAISLGALVTPAVLHAGLHVALLVFGAGVPALCLLALPRLLQADRVAAVGAVAVAPRVAILEHLDLFQNATRASLESLAGAAEEIAVPAGTVVIAEGDQADAFYVLTDGRLDVSAIGETGTEPTRLRTLEPVSYAGEIGLLGHLPRTATVIAGSPSVLLRIGGEDFLDALTNLSASPSLLEGARTRLAITHPSSRALEPLLPGHGAGDADEAAAASPGIAARESPELGDPPWLGGAAWERSGR
jgi:CRP-like cAMP-binding protein/predicted MFS family arabinose efflux permease